MISDILLYVGSVAIVLWGIAHIVPTRSVVGGFGPISEDNRRIITMEWVAEGLTLCFVGALVLLVTLFGNSQETSAVIVYRLSALMLVAMAAWTGVTGARTAIVPIKICPLVKTVVAVLFFLGSALRV